MRQTKRVGARSALVATAAAFWLAAAAVAQAQVPFDAAGGGQAFAFEDKDWSVEAPKEPKGRPYHAPTPTRLPGGRVILTMPLKALLETHPDVVVVDVLESRSRESVPGAVWMSGVGSGTFYGAEKSRYEAALSQLTAGQKARPLVFLCLSSECWLSYNAALRALEAGFTDVIWYRGGTDAWKGASLPMAPARAVSW